LPQGSPCCAAASTAGAFNALWGFGRKVDNSASIREVAELMALHCEKLCDQRQRRVERLLGVSQGSLTEVLALVDAELQARGLVWTQGSGAGAVTKTTAMAALRAVIRTAAEAAEPTALSSEVTDATGEAADGQGESVEVAAPVASEEAPLPSPSPPKGAMAALREALGEVPEKPGNEGADGADSEDTEAGNAGGVIVVNCGPNWDVELGELFAKRKGVHRLRAEKPNTGEIGSWGIKQAADDLAAARSCDPIRVTTLLGRKGSNRVEVSVDKCDDAVAIEQQWNVLKVAFGKPHTVLLFHLKNHYALIFAWREWQEEAQGAELAPRYRRQILTARKGQRPTVWLDFEEAREIMLGWTGYHILQLHRVVLDAAAFGGPTAPSVSCGGC